MRIIFHDCNYDIYTDFCVHYYLNYKNNSYTKKEIYEYIKTNQRNISKLSIAPGNLIYMGKDKLNNKIYILNRRKYKNIVCQALKGLIDIFNPDKINSDKKVTFFNLGYYRNIYLSGIHIIKLLNSPEIFTNKIYLMGILKIKNQFKNDLIELHENVKKESN